MKVKVNKKKNDDKQNFTITHMYIYTTDTRVHTRKRTDKHKKNISNKQIEKEGKMKK